MRSILFLAALGCLSGCQGETFSRFEVVLKDDALHEAEVYRETKAQLLEQMPEMGGRCSVEERSTICRFPDQFGQPSTEISAEHGQNGEVTLSVASTFRNKTPPVGSESERYDLHMRLVAWVKTKSVSFYNL